MPVCGFIVPLNDSFRCPSRHRQLGFPLWNELGLLDETLKDLDWNLFGLPPSLSSERGNTLVGQYVEDDGKYKINVQLGKNVGPNDLKVTLKDRIVTVEAKKEENSEDGSSRVYQEFTRKFTLPQNVEMNEVKSLLTPDGVLQIEAPVTQPQIENKEPPKQIEIPISKV